MKCISHLSFWKFVHQTIPAPKDCVRELDMTSSNPPHVIEVFRTSAKTCLQELRQKLKTESRNSPIKSAIPPLSYCY